MKILEVSASGRRADSVSRKLSNELIEALETREGAVEVTRRDLSDGIPLVDERWIQANFTPEEERTRDQRDVLSVSDALVKELQAADVIVIGSPIYNFGIPAELKAWVDMIARARKTFRYTSNGPEGLLKGKKAYVVIASGGVPRIGTPACSSATASLRGVCPPNWTITPSGFSSSAIESTSSKVSGSK